MTVPTVAWDETSPPGSQAAALLDTRISEMKIQIREIMGVDHKFDSSGQDADMGKHNKCTFIEAVDIGTGAEGLPILGAQTVSGRAELMFTNEDDASIQLVSGTSMGAAATALLCSTIAAAGAGTFATTLGVTGIATFTTDIKIQATKKIYLDGGGNTYISETGGDSIGLTAGGVNGLAISATAISIPATNKLYLDGGGNTYFFEAGADSIQAYCGGILSFLMAPTAIGIVANNVIYLNAGTDTAYIGYNSASSKISFFVGGVERFYINASGGSDA